MATSGAADGKRPHDGRHEACEELQRLQQDNASDEDREAYISRFVAKPLTEETTDEVYRIALRGRDEFSARVIAALLKTEAGYRYAAHHFTNHPTKTFNDLWDSGAASVRAFVVDVVLRPRAWDSDDGHKQAETYAVQLLLSKMLEPGIDDPHLALYGLARLMALDAAYLEQVMDTYALNMMFDAYNRDNCAETRSQATLIIAKLFEVAQARVGTDFTAFVAKQIQSQKIDRLILVCSAVSSLFPVMTKVTSEMILRDSFLPSMMQLVDRSDSSAFRKAALELLSAACMDRHCREAIRKQCGSWVWEHAQSINGNNSDGAAAQAQTIAAVVCAKIRADVPDGNLQEEDLVRLLKGFVLGGDVGTETLDHSIEALTYQSTQPTVKQSISSDDLLLKKILLHLTQPRASGMTIYTGLVLMSNLTKYPPIISPEQQKLAELKAYADRSKALVIHDLDKDGPVSERCRRVLDAGIGPVLVSAARKASPSLLTVISQIVLAVSKHPKHRGMMVQQGLLDTSVALASVETSSQASTPSAKRNAALALARILIPIDPSLLFKKRPVEPVVAAMNHLLTVPLTSEDTRIDEQYWSGQPIVTALQALSNLASLTATAHSSDPDHATNTIITTCLTPLDDHFESSTPAIRTAATELFVNLSQAPTGYVLFSSPEDSKSLHRFRILTAYFGDEDLKLRLAAGGALATVLGFGEPATVERFSETEHGIEYTVEALEDKDEGLRARSIVIVSAMLQMVDHDDVSENLKQKIIRMAKESFMPAISHSQKLGIPRGSEQPFAEISKIMKSLRSI